MDILMKNIGLHKTDGLGFSEVGISSESMYNPE